MIFNAENILLIGSILLFVSIVVSKTGYRFGIPTLLVFLLVGMLFGSDGLGLQFHDAGEAQFIGMMALSIILFSGGMDTKYSDIKPVLPQGILLSTFGVLLTTIFTGFFIFMDETWTFTTICLIYTVRLFGLAMVNMPINTWGLNALENKMIAHGSAINNTARQIAGSIGTAILITIMTTVTSMNQSSGVINSTLSGMHAAFGTATGLGAIALLIAVIFRKTYKT